jgi:hypothetical protein
MHLPAASRAGASRSLIAALAVVFSGAVLGVSAPSLARGAEPARPNQRNSLPAAVVCGLNYLARTQRPDGGWNSSARPDDADLATTSIAGLAFLRAGGTMRNGPSAAILSRAEAFVTTAVAGASDEMLLRPSTGDPLVHADLGPGIDGILSACFLAELLGAGVPEPEEPRVRATLERLLDFIGSAHDADAFAFHGSRILSMALAAHALSSAERSGVPVDERTRKGLFTAAVNVHRNNGVTGTDFYACAAVAGTLHMAPGVLAAGIPSGEFIRADEGTANTTRTTRATTSQIRRSLASVRDQWSRTVSRPGWRGVPGSGGEIYLSTALVGDMLKRTDSTAWPTWHRQVGQQLAQLQDGQGSRTFCTSAAVLAILSDRANPSSAD